MKKLFAIVLLLAVMVLFGFSTSATAQIETKVTQNFTINGDGWNKVLRYGTPVTIFSYKKESDKHSFGIYSDDYAGIIHMKIIPFDVDAKGLKKLPGNSKKKVGNLYR